MAPPKKGRFRRKKRFVKKKKAYASRLRDKKINTAVERAAKRIAKQEDQKQILWKIHRDDFGLLGNTPGWVQYQNAAAAGRYNYISGYWSGNSTSSWSRISSSPIAYFLMDMKKQTFLPTSVPANPTAPTYHQDLGGVTNPVPTLQSRPNQLRITDTIKIKSISLLVDLNYPIPLYTSPAPPGVPVPQLDDRGFVDVYCKLLRVKGTNVAVSPTFVVPQNATTMLRPTWFHHEKLLDTVTSDKPIVGDVQVVAKTRLRLHTSVHSQRRLIRLNYRPKNPKIYRFMLNSNNPNSTQAPMTESYFLQIYNTSPQPGVQLSPTDGGAHMRVRVLSKIEFCDAQI